MATRSFRSILDSPPGAGMFELDQVRSKSFDDLLSVPAHDPGVRFAAFLAPVPILDAADTLGRVEVPQTEGQQARWQSGVARPRGGAPRDSLRRCETNNPTSGPGVLATRSIRRIGRIPAFGR